MAIIRNIIIAVTLLVYLGAITIGTHSEKCNYSICSCKKKFNVATCWGTKNRPLYYIPKLPQFVQKVTLSKGYYPELTKQLLFNLTFNNITSLTFRNSQIVDIDADAFEDMSSLEMLEIAENYKLTPKKASIGLQSLCKISGFQRLNFRLNYWKNISMSLFEHLRCTTITTISLSGNNIPIISARLFENLTHLEYLDLSDNYIEKILDAEHFMTTNINKLDLRHNRLLYLPSFCWTGDESVLPNLEYLDLSINDVGRTVTPSSFKCLRKLKRLHLDKNRFSILQNNMFSEMVELESLYLTGIELTKKKIEKFAFNISNLLKLNFAGNNFHFNKAGIFDARLLFSLVPKLQVLDLTNNFLPWNSLTKIMFQGLTEMRKLILQRTGLEYMPTGVFSRMPKLHTLILSGNYISGWGDDPDVFGNISSLQTLILDGTRVKVFNKTSFPPNIMSSLRKINLAHNEFSCTCDQLWFMQWIKKTTIKLLNYPHAYLCRFPPKMNKVTLNNYNPTKESCAVKNYTVVIVTSVSCVCFVIFVLVIVVYKCRWHIRYWIYLLRTRKKGYIQLQNIDGYTYDAFVIYCEDDRDFVHTNLVNELEEKEGLRLCIHERDFSIGKLIIDNIVENIHASRKIIIVLSNSFERSEWCRFELLLAHKRFLNEGNDILVVAMLEEINSHHLNSSLKALITTTTYAVWTEEEAGNQLFWGQILSAFQ